MSQNPQTLPSHSGNTNTIAHCLHCGFSWVIREGTKGKQFSHVSGRVCPFCSYTDSIEYSQEDNR